MNSLLRFGLLVGESILSGPAYGGIKFLIRSPEPLDPDKTWDFVTAQRPPLQRWIQQNYPPRFLRRLIHGHHFKQDHAVGVADHYDVSNEFYELFLDKEFMFYTCADFHQDTQTIEEAQTNKANFLLDLIDPQRGEKILELGCGWGSMMKRIYQTTGDKENLYGYTLSHEQVAYNEQHLGFHVEYRNFITTDYADETYDKIYSIGAWEAVRPEDHFPLMQKLYRALRPGGRLVLHFFCLATDKRPASSLCGLIFFPGHVLSSYRFYLDDFEQAGFHIAARSLHDYRPTLRCWFDNLVANKERAIELVGVETYNRYLVFFPASWRFFQDGTGMLIRWVLNKPMRVTESIAKPAFATRAAPAANAAN